MRSPIKWKLFLRISKKARLVFFNPTPSSLKNSDMMRRVNRYLNPTSHVTASTTRKRK